MFSTCVLFCWKTFFFLKDGDVKKEFIKVKESNTFKTEHIKTS